MKRILLILACLLWAHPSFAQIAFVNSTSGSDYSGTAASALATSALNVSASNFVAVCTRMIGSVTVTSVTDTAMNTYHQAIERNAVNTTSHVALYYAYNASGNASNVVTVHTSGNVQYWGVLQLQYSGVQTASDPLDQTASGDDTTSTSSTSGAFTTTVANELLLACGEYDSSPGNIWITTSPYTIEQQDASNVEMAQDQIVSSIQTGVTATVTVNSSHNLSILVATFKAPGGGGGGTTSHPGLLLGVFK